jgi:Tfp pilus assembly protein PilN
VLDVNLLPADSRPVRVEDGNLQRLGLVLLAACLLVGIGYGILKTITVQRAHRVQALQQQATTLAQAIDKFRPALKVLQATSAKVLAIQQLLSHRPDWNELFNRIEDLTLTSVSYNSASITSDGDVVITVEATTVSDLARQLRVFESATSTFSSVTLGGISVGEATEGQVPLIQSTFQLKLAPAWAKAPQSSAGN